MDTAFDRIGAKLVELRFPHFRIVIHFGFLAVLTLLFLRIQELLIRQTLLVCLVHELGHGIAMCLTGSGIQEIRFHAAGIRIQTDTCLLRTGQAVLISLSGPLINLIFAGLLWQIQPVPAILHLSMGVFNLLPYQVLDGGTALAYLFESSPQILKGISIFSILCSIALIMILSIWEIQNPLLYFMLIYLAISEADELLPTLLTKYKK